MAAGDTLIMRRRGFRRVCLARTNDIVFVGIASADRHRTQVRLLNDPFDALEGCEGFATGDLTKVYVPTGTNA
ncbi:hypothetical protein [Beijerinckia sp. L45]|uniref:hypothetical protein n=1 Tax=Beijerinckia sp. L45 TaxID=1641855 RepID=UPI00131BCC8E|nr:hypothetical protein [Beijerinckia sp. L45]